MRKRGVAKDESVKSKADEDENEGEKEEEEVNELVEEVEKKKEDSKPKSAPSSTVVFDQIVQLQNADGSWELNDQLAQIIIKTEPAIKSGIANGDC